MGRRLEEQVPEASGSWRPERPPARRRTRPLVAALVVLLGAGAFLVLRSYGLLPWQREDPEPTGSAAIDPAQAPATPTPTASPEPDFTKVLAEISLNLELAWRERRPELVDVVYLPSCDCNESTKERIQWYLDHRVVVPGYTLILSDLTVLERPGPEEARIRFMREVKPFPVFNERMEKIDDDPGVPPEPLIAHLQRVNGRWVVASIGLETPESRG